MKRTQERVGRLTVIIISLTMGLILITRCQKLADVSRIQQIQTKPPETPIPAGYGRAKMELPDVVISAGAEESFARMLAERGDSVLKDGKLNNDILKHYGLVAVRNSSVVISVGDPIPSVDEVEAYVRSNVSVTEVAGSGRKVMLQRRDQTNIDATTQTPEAAQSAEVEETNGIPEIYNVSDLADDKEIKLEPRTPTIPFDPNKMRGPRPCK